MSDFEIKVLQLRNILPASVSARLIADVLEDSETSDKMRDRALHLLNVKLTQETSFTTEGAISTEHLDAFAGKLNQWLKPVESKNEVYFALIFAEFSG